MKLTLLRTLWGIEGPEDEVEVKKVVIKAFRASQQPISTSRGSNDPEPQEEPNPITTCSQNIKERLEATLNQLKNQEAELKQEYLTIRMTRDRIPEEDVHSFMFDIIKIGRERANA